MPEIPRKRPHRHISETCAILGPDYPVGMFFLTRKESLVIILVMIALTAGVGIRHCRLNSDLPAEVR
jgi:hypothetical protein